MAKNTTRYFDFYNIDWDTSDWDEEEELASGKCVPDLPEEVDHVGIDDPDWDPDEDGADLLTAVYGYCVNSFEWEEVKPKKSKKREDPGLEELDLRDADCALLLAILLTELRKLKSKKASKLVQLTDMAKKAHESELVNALNISLSRELKNPKYKVPVE